MLNRFLTDLSIVHHLLDVEAPRETTEVLRRSLDELAEALVRTREGGALDALIVDAALLFDAVEDVRRVASVLDHDIRPVAERIDRLLREIMGDVADTLSGAVHPEDAVTGPNPPSPSPSLETYDFSP